MSDEDLRARIANLEARVAELEHSQLLTQPLGPSKPRDEYVMDDKTKESIRKLLEKRTK